MDLSNPPMTWIEVLSDIGVAVLPASGTRYSKSGEMQLNVPFPLSFWGLLIKAEPLGQGYLHYHWVTGGLRGLSLVTQQFDGRAGFQSNLQTYWACLEALYPPIRRHIQTKHFGVLTL